MATPLARVFKNHYLWPVTLLNFHHYQPYMAKGKGKGKGNTYSQLKGKYAFLEDPKDNDLVIAVMGRTGAGKSTFINALFGEAVAAAGHTLQSATSKVQHYEFSHPHYTDRRILVVDTPGFDDKDIPEKDILERIAIWLANSYEAGMKLAGLVYIFDINTTRLGAAEAKSYEIFEALCGKDRASKVILATSKWDKLQDVKEGEDREKELEEVFWVDMFQNGSTIHRLRRSRETAGESAEESAQESAQKVMDSILSHSFVGRTAIQEELVDKKKGLNEIAAFRVLDGEKVKEKTEEKGFLGFIKSKFK